MKNRLLITIAFIVISFQVGFTQTKREFKTWNPATDSLQVLGAQAWPKEVKDYYDRLPERAEKTVRKDVWDLSKNSAGLNLRFKTNADEIIIKYVVSGGKQMPHMPATGVSGIDLYAKNSDGKWLWASGQYSFGDTVVYRFKGLKSKDDYVKNLQYTMYLPLYNSVKWMQISVPKEAEFIPLSVRKEKPIVVYGTSIAQGACASRPGLAWTNILGRKLDRTVINLGFSGNGRLEKELIDLLTEIDARVYVLDCLPNLTAPQYIATGELKKRIVSSIKQLQEKRPSTPILFTEHDGYTDDGINLDKKKQYQDVNTALREVLDSLSATGIKNVFLLSKKEINQDIETMVDGTHPNDAGMMRYADAYEKALSKILKEPIGDNTTTIPVTQGRDASTYNWETRHNAVLAYNKTHQPQVIFLGNSITNYWSGEPKAPIRRGETSWQKYFEPKQAANFGFGWDRIENVLWRVYHNELDGISPSHIVLMIGTNNLQLNKDEDIVTGLQFLVNAIHEKQPGAKIILLGILPRRAMEDRVASLNKLLAKTNMSKNTLFADAGKLFLKTDKKIDEALFTDGLHPNEQGYEKLGAFIATRLK
ncbi:acetylhydrolase [Pedobacter sp. LMG 31464]|uniref:Acetylhydrolase n=1 Tax=Pedobacter planticolens TaxID=2679964 RepID=A0A923IWF6_9SPHI|nr:SGNH/GDSL hydrolase family protein [Pedobacter planticolens]MBB2146863.1 acetylhydrolase [Pedobacter planticolens]